MPQSHIVKSNANAFKSISRVLPGGVDGNAKYFDNMPVASHAWGCHITDVEGREYIDYCCGYGPLIFGHNDPEITSALANSMINSGILYGLPHPSIEEAINLICDCIPCAEMVRFTNSGTEATMTCIRLARGITKRDKIIKFSGAYHGTHDGVMISTKLSENDPDYPQGQPSSAGLTKNTLQDTCILPFNDTEYACRFIAEHSNEIAGVLVEPMLGNYGLLAEKEFLENLRNITKDKGILLIFDEVVTAFRLNLGGIQKTSGVIPDLAALGKAMGGGYPIGAVAGPTKYMDYIAPHGSKVASEVVWHSGTYNASPVAMAGVIATINKLKNTDALAIMDKNSKQLRQALNNLIQKYKIKGVITGDGPFIQIFFGIEGDITRPEQLIAADTEKSKRFHQLLLQQGIFLIPGLRAYVSAAHGQSDIDQTISAFDKAFQML